MSPLTCSGKLSQHENDLGYLHMLRTLVEEFHDFWPEGRLHRRLVHLRRITGALVVWTYYSLIPLVPRDQACATVESQVQKSPADKNDEPVLKLGQVHQVHEQPQQPRRKPVKVQAPEIRDARGAADDREAPFIQIAKALRLTPAEPFEDRLGRVSPLLHGH